ncbi:salicylate synthase [Nonomuraea mesophila]|uniref:Salicylate synthase n=1 Tax=Nonomuraea mesophila TaxID=2530382 RepID=A0A4R5FSY0_9ACTN|nr:salicylate synthase [Nonomuraea mesophila]TDE56539.1 salicylate synthase [Nonomuraea mesophila]
MTAGWAAAIPRPAHEAHVELPEDPASAAVRLAQSGIGDQYAVYERRGTWHFATGLAGSVTVDAERVRAWSGGHGRETPTAGKPLERVTELLAALPDAGWRGYGWASFELAHLLRGKAPGPGPLFHLFLPRVEAELTRGGARIRAASEADLRRAAQLLSRAEAAPAVRPLPVSLDAGAQPYRRAVARTVEDIKAGRLNKAVLSRVLHLPDGLDLFATYLAGRAAATPARSFLFDMGGWRAAGFSPETVVEIGPDRRISTQPLAGTRALGQDPGENTRLREQLLNDPKEVIEHVISVRLAFEELTEVCDGGTVSIGEFMEIRKRGAVQHIASRVSGKLRDGVPPWSAFAALFPAVTATGVPKAAALDVIRDRESAPRGLYGGAVFMTDADGALDAALTLRTVFQRDGRNWLRAGAGIMGQSTPEREWEETCEKLRSVAPHLRARTEGATKA